MINDVNDDDFDDEKRCSGLTLAHISRRCLTLKMKPELMGKQFFQRVW